MKITVAADVFAATSTIKVEDIELLAKYKPEALVETDKDGEEVFRVAYTKGHPSVRSYGVEFGGVSRDGEGFATISGALPDGTKDAKEYLADLFGAAIPHIEKFEESIPAAAEEIRGKKQALMDSIEEK